MAMDINERSASITVNGENYELILTTKATKELAARYGGLENLGDKLMQSEKSKEQKRISNRRKAGTINIADGFSEF